MTLSAVKLLMTDTTRNNHSTTTSFLRNFDFKCSEVGSNRRRDEDRVYKLFTDYIREVYGKHSKGLAPRPNIFQLSTLEIYSKYKILLVLAKIGSSNFAYGCTSIVSSCQALVSSCYSLFFYTRSQMWYIFSTMLVQIDQKKCLMSDYSFIIIILTYHPL